MNLEVEVVRNTYNVCVTISQDNLGILSDETQSMFIIYLPIDQNFVIDIVDNSELLVCQIVGVYSWDQPDDTSRSVTRRNARSPSPSNRRRVHSPSPPTSPLAEGRKRIRYEETLNENYSLSTATLHNGEYYQASLPIYDTHSETSTISDTGLIEWNNQSPRRSNSSTTLTADNLANSSFGSNSDEFELDFIPGLITSLNRDIEEEDSYLS